METIQAVNLELFKALQDEPTNSFKVHIENFQNIRNADLEFNTGITVIGGDSNNGKSAILRAIKSAVFNRLGDDFINFDAKKCLVEINNAGKTLTWTKTRDGERTKYVINGEPFVKVGRGQFPKVLEVVNFKEIKILDQVVKLNFWDQMAFPFLMDKTPGQLFQFFALSSDNEKIAAALKKMKEDLGDYNDKINITHAKIDVLREDVINLEKLNGALIVYTPEFEGILSMDSEMSSLVELEKLMNSTIYQRDCISALNHYLKQIDVEKIFLITSEITVLDDLQVKITDYSSLNRMYEIAVTNKKGFEDLNAFTSGFTPLDLPPFIQEINTFNEMGRDWQKGRDCNSALNSILTGLKILNFEPVEWNEVLGKEINYFYQLNQVASQIQSMKTANDNFQVIPKPEPVDVSDALTLIKEVEAMQETIQGIIAVNESLKSVNSLMENSKKELDMIKAEMAEFKQCPLCGGAFGDCGGRV